MQPKSSQRGETVKAEKGLGGDPIIMPMILEKGIQHAHIGVMLRCPQTLGHLMR